MAHFAELDQNNIVIGVHALDNSVMEDAEGNKVEQIGVDFLKNLHGSNTVWKQTSYNTKGGVYYNPQTSEPDQDQSKSFRKNYAGIGYTYDENRNAFINPKPIVDESVEQYVTFDEFSCLWYFSPPTANIEIGVNRV